MPPREPITAEERHAGEILARVITLYFAARYPGRDIKAVCTYTTGDESALARSLFKYQQALAA